MAIVGAATSWTENPVGRVAEVSSVVHVSGSTLGVSWLDVLNLRQSAYTRCGGGALGVTGATGDASMDTLVTLLLAVSALATA